MVISVHTLPQAPLSTNSSLCPFSFRRPSHLFSLRNRNLKLVSLDSAGKKVPTLLRRRGAGEPASTFHAPPANPVRTSSFTAEMSEDRRIRNPGGGSTGTDTQIDTNERFSFRERNNPRLSVENDFPKWEKMETETVYGDKERGKKCRVYGLFDLGSLRFIPVPIVWAKTSSTQVTTAMTSRRFF